MALGIVIVGFLGSVTLRSFKLYYKFVREDLIIERKYGLILSFLDELDHHRYYKYFKNLIHMVNKHFEPIY